VNNSENEQKRIGYNFLGLINDIKRRPEDAANTILTDTKHLDNNPKKVSKEDIIKLLKIIQNGKAIE